MPGEAVPVPSDSAHLGEPDVRPALPSTVTVRRLPRVCEVPKPTSRLSACVESTCPTSPENDTLAVHPSATSTLASMLSDVALGAVSADWLETPERPRLAPTDRCTGSTGETPAPRSSPTLVWPLPRPHCVLPVGKVTLSDAAKSGDQGPGSSCSTATLSGRSPSPRLVRRVPFVSSVTRTKVGEVESVIQARG